MDLGGKMGFSMGFFMEVSMLLLFFLKTRLTHLGKQTGEVSGKTQTSQTPLKEKNASRVKKLTISEKKQ